MKIKKLLVLSALMLLGVNGAWAADLVERTAPEQPSWVIDVASIDRTPCEFQVGDVYVLYNVGADKFYYLGNAWGTQATGSATSAIPVRFVLPEGKTLADKQLYLRDFDNRSDQNKWRTAFIAIDGSVGNVYGTGTPAIFIDNNDGGAALMWVEASGDKTYNLSISEDNTTAKPEGMFVGIDPEGSGVNGGATGTCIMPKVAKGTNTDWQFFAAPAEMTDYFKAEDVYNAAENLKKEIATAESLGADVSAAAAVYNDLASTIDQINAAIKALKDAMGSSYTNGTGKDPKDASFLMTNPTFDTIGDFHGWSGTAFGAGGTTSTNAEWYQAGQGADAYQELSGVAPGYYIAGVKGYYRAGDTQTSFNSYKSMGDYSPSVQFYVTANEQTYETNICSIFKDSPTTDPKVSGQTSAKDDETGLTYYVPNTMASAEVFMHKMGMYDNFVIAQVGEDKALRIGVKKTGEQIGSDWAIFDDFTLTYVGTNPDDRYPGLLWIQLKNYPTFADQVVTKSLLDTYMGFKSNEDARLAVKDEAAYNAFMSQLIDAKAACDENAALWSQWKALVDKGLSTYRELSDKVQDKSIAANLLRYVDDSRGSWKAIQEACALSNEELQAEMTTLQGYIDAFEQAAKSGVQPGDDVTSFLTNPNFDDTYRSATGWTVAAGSVTCQGSEANGKHINQGIEAFNQANFDVYQELENVPVGIYEISVQGFYRYGRGDDAYNDHKAQAVDYVKPGGAPVYVYLNDVKTPFKNVYDEPSQGMEFYASCAEVDEEGVPKANDSGIYQWKGIWNGNVQNVGVVDPMEFYPNDMISGAVAFSAGLYTQSAFSLVANAGDKLRLGVKGSSNQKGDSWVIWDNFKLTYQGTKVEYVKPTLETAIKNAEKVLFDPETGEIKPLGKDAYELLNTALQEAKTAYEGSDGAVMFEKLIALVAVNVEASQKKFEELNAKKKELEVAYGNAAYDQTSSRPTEESINAALALLTQIDEGITKRSLTDADADELMVKVDEAIAALRIPAGINNATDENPVDATNMITNADYNDGTNGWTREEGSTGNYGVEFAVCENFNGKFNVFQELTLPAGTYELAVKSFYRYSSAVDDYKAENADKNLMDVYVTTGGNTVALPSPRLNAIAQTIDSWEVDENSAFKSQDNYVWAVTQEELNVMEVGSWANGPQVPNMRTAVRDILDNNEELAANLLTKIIFKVGDDGKATIGVKKTEEVSNDWSAWANWTLTYFGKESAKEPTVNSIVNVAATGAKVELFGLNGARISKPTKGIAIMKQTLNDGTVKTSKVIIK